MNPKDDLLFELQNLMIGYAGARPERADALVGPSWALAAWVELLRRHPLVAAMDDELLRAIASRQLDPNALAREVSFRLSELERDEAQESQQEAAEGDIPPHMREQMLATVALIARDELGVRTLEVRGRDALDFHECGVGSIRAALIAAYVEGWHAAA